MKWTNREYVDLMTYNHPKRPMFSELFGPIVGLPDEWRKQGATEDMIAMRGFAFDYVPYYNLGNLDSIHRPKDIVIENTDTRYVGIDHYGRRVRMDKRTSTIPLPESYPVETMDDWMKIKHMFEYDACRISDDEIEKAKRLQNEGVVIKSEILGGFDILRELMGEENCCIAFYEDPELIEDILNTISETNVRVLSQISKKRLKSTRTSLLPYPKVSALLTALTSAKAHKAALPTHSDTNIFPEPEKRSKSQSRKNSDARFALLN